LPPSEISQLVEAMRCGEPWKSALARLDLPVLQRKGEWFAAESKSRVYADLGTAQRGDALDVGAGSGVIAFGLSSSYNRVIALEQDTAWSEFMRLRFRQDGAENVEVVHGGALPLPFPDASFDLIVVNGVLEWLPEAAPDSRSPREVQLGFLQDVHRTLRPGGAVGIAIENRLCLENFRGASPHYEPPYVVLMPRPVADWRCRALTGKPYRNWIYGPAGYRRLLRDAGFAEPEIRAVLPTYHDPKEVVELEDVARIRKSMAARNPLRRAVLGLASATGLLGSLVHSFYISSRK